MKAVWAMFRHQKNNFGKVLDDLGMIHLKVSLLQADVRDLAHKIELLTRMIREQQEAQQDSSTSSPPILQYNVSAPENDLSSSDSSTYSSESPLYESHEQLCTSSD